MIRISEQDLARLAAALAETKAARAKADHAFSTFRHKLAVFEEILTDIKPIAGAGR